MRLKMKMKPSFRCDNREREREKEREREQMKTANKWQPKKGIENWKLVPAPCVCVDRV